MREAGLLPMIAAAALLGCTLGCSSGDSELLPVAGQVRLGDRSLTTGTVSLRPDAAAGNKSQHQPTGSIDGDGHYRIFTAGKPGAAAGSYRVVVFATEPLADSKAAHPALPKSLLPAKYSSETATPLRLQVHAEAAADAYDLQLELPH